MDKMIAFKTCNSLIRFNWRKIDQITLFCVLRNDDYLQVPAFREIAKNYLKQVRGGEENQNEHSDDEETETRADEN